MSVHDSEGDPADDQTAESSLVEILPGTALVFGKVPSGLELLPLPSSADGERDQFAQGAAHAGTALNVSAQIVNGLLEPMGFVRLAPQTMHAMRSGLTVVKSGGWNIGVLRGAGGQFAAQVRWLPATGAGAVSTVAGLSPAIAMMAMQIQLDEITKLAKRNLELTGTVLDTLQNEQWAELTGLAQTMDRAIDEARAVGEVTPTLWSNIAGSESALRKQRDLYRRKIERHVGELAKRSDHSEQRDYIDTNGRTIVYDLRSLLVAHRSYFQYQMLRAERAKALAATDQNEARLVQTISDHAREDYGQVVEDAGQLIDALNRELHLLAELPGKRTLPFTGGRKDRDAVTEVTESLLQAVEQLSVLVGRGTIPDPEPETILVTDRDRLPEDLRILRWQLERGEQVQVIAIEHETLTGDAFIVVTDRRVIEADVSDLRRYGTIRRSIPNADIRYVRVRAGDKPGKSDLDLITAQENITWHLVAPAAEVTMEPLTSAIAERMHIPDGERLALTSAPSGGSETGRHAQVGEDSAY